MSDISKMWIEIYEKWLSIVIPQRIIKGTKDIIKSAACDFAVVDRFLMDIEGVTYWPTEPKRTVRRLTVNERWKIRYMREMRKKGEQQ